MGAVERLGKRIFNELLSAGNAAFVMKILNNPTMVSQLVRYLQDAAQSTGLGATEDEMKSKVIAALLRAERPDLANAVAGLVVGRAQHFKPSRYVDQYEDQVAMLATNNYGPWKDVKEAESHVKRAIRDLAKERYDDVLQSFKGKDDIRYIVETYMFEDTPDPYNVEPPDPKVGKSIENVLQKLLGKDWKSWAGTRPDKGQRWDASNKAWQVWIEGHPKYTVDNLWKPLAQALGRGYHVEVEDNVTLLVVPEGAKASTSKVTAALRRIKGSVTAAVPGVKVRDVEFSSGQEPEGLDENFATTMMVNFSVEGPTLAKLLGVQQRVLDTKLAELRKGKMERRVFTALFDSKVGDEILKSLRPKIIGLLVEHLDRNVQVGARGIAWDVNSDWRTYLVQGKGLVFEVEVEVDGKIR